MVPGPSIQVCRNDYLIIDLKNEAEGLEASIHWHGIFQNGYQYYDGVPYLTQCPIGSANTFRYIISNKIFLS
ncbi:PREDICTED: laccase-2-like [Vollenhovia emeryi]|uniref:laccase-2-like n=1 Tax=Vollenhovia emeryi TaxID=411798 RepID=UPI0005F371FF|nr:PREDICTED: laccase-2-like [Vollenhovia emeryi]